MRIRLSRLVGTRFQVLFHSPPGVLFTFPSRYLSAIGHQGVFRLSGWSRQIHTEFHGLGATWETRSRDSTFSCTGLSPSTATPSRGLPLTTLFSYSSSARQNTPNGPTTPTTQRLPAITCNRFSLIRFRSPLLTESRLFSLPVGTEMFHFPTFPPHALCVQARVTPHDWCGVPPFGNPRINARLTAPRGLSQPPTSFIGSWCQGIHRAPLTTWPHTKPHHTTPGRKRCGGPTQTLKLTESEDARVHCAVLNVRPDTDPAPPPDPRPPQGQRRYDRRSAPTQDRSHPTTGGGPLSQDPTACLRTGTRTTDSAPRTPRRACRTGSPHRGPAELVSVPPSSTTPGAPRPSEDRMTVTSWARLCTNEFLSGTAPVKCSLERR